jgi:hypothetical protein
MDVTPPAPWPYEVFQSVLSLPASTVPPIAAISAEAAVHPRGSHDHAERRTDVLGDLAPGDRLDRGDGDRELSVEIGDDRCLSVADRGQGPP